MKIDIIQQPLQFRLHGLSSVVENHTYGETGLRLMDAMWRSVNETGLKTTGINYWVYLDGDRMFTGVEVRDLEPAESPGSLELCAFELTRYAKHLHIGPYHDLPQKWQALKDELAQRGETVTMPSLEVYDHSCEDADEHNTETTILLGLKC